MGVGMVQHVSVNMGMGRKVSVGVRMGGMRGKTIVNGGNKYDRMDERRMLGGMGRNV